jgi:hypothetical protein
VRLAACLLVAAVAGLVPAAPASAECNAALYVATGRCANQCTLAAAAYEEARAASGNVLPPFGPCSA